MAVSLVTGGALIYLLTGNEYLFKVEPQLKGWLNVSHPSPTREHWVVAYCVPPVNVSQHKCHLWIGIQSIGSVCEYPVAGDYLFCELLANKNSVLNDIKH